MKSIAVKRDGFTVRRIGEETILVNDKGDTLHTLNDTGSFIFQHIDGTTPIGEICLKLSAEFDVPTDGTLEMQVGAFLDELEREGIIRFL